MPRFTIRRFAIALLVTALVLDAVQRVGHSQDSAQEDPLAKVRDLRQQRRYRQAITQIEKLKSELKPTDYSQQIQLEIESLQCRVAALFELPPAARWKGYRAILESVKEFRQQHLRNPNLILIDVQQAFVTLRFAELIRKEFEAGGAGDQQVVLARELLREVSRQLESLDRQLDQSIPQTPRKTGSGKLNQRQLISLQNQVRYQQARIKINQGLLYKNESPQNQMAMLVAAQSELEEVLPLLEKVDRTWWQARRDLAMCLRKQGNLRGAEALVDSVPVEEADSQVQLMFRAEKIRILLQKQDWNQLERIIRSVPSVDASNTADFDLAALEYFIAKMQLAEGDPQKRMQASAIKTVEVIGERHGPYWEGRARQSLVAALRVAKSKSSSAWIQIAQESYRNQRLADAIVEFENAAKAAKSELNRKLEMELRFQAVMLHRDLGEHEKVGQKCAAILNEFQDLQRTAVVSLVGILSTAELMRTGKRQLKDYLNQIENHLQTWPQHPTVAKVAYYQGKVANATKDYLAAAFAFRLSILAVVRQSGALDIEQFDRSMAELNTTLIGIKSGAYSAKEMADFKHKFDGNNFFETVYSKTSDLETTVLGWATFALEVDQQQLDRAFELLQQESKPKGDTLISKIRIALLMDPTKASIEPGAIIARLSEPESARLLAALERDWIKSQKPITKLVAQLVSQLNVNQEQQLEHLNMMVPSLVRTGNSEKALNLLGKAIEMDGNAWSARVQRARLWTDSRKPKQLDLALDEWRRILARSRPKSKLWFRAKYGIARCHYLSGNQKQAKTILDLMKTIPPGWKDSELSADFEVLYRQVSVGK